MPYDLDAMEAQINAAMESPDRVRFRPGATYDPKDVLVTTTIDSMAISERT